MAGFLDWSLKVDDVGPAGYAAKRPASVEECRQVALDLDAVSVERLSADVTIRAVSTGRYRLSGRLEALLTQTCVVTLEPVQSRIDEELSAELWPAEDIGPLADGEHSVLEGDVPEPVENGRIAIGRIVFEHLAAAIDPYPRKEDASFDAEALGVGEQSSKPAGPFAVLSKLKPTP